MDPQAPPRLTLVEVAEGAASMAVRCVNPGFTLKQRHDYDKGRGAAEFSHAMFVTNAGLFRKMDKLRTDHDAIDSPSAEYAMGYRDRAAEIGLPFISPSSQVLEGQ